MEYMCSICLDSLFSVNTDVSVTQCGHLFHKSCLNGSMQNNDDCPICREPITSIVRRIYPTVFDGLVYNSTSNETEAFLGKMSDLEKDTKEKTLAMVKKLDEENINLKRLNESYEENIKTCKVYIDGIQVDQKEWEKKSRNLQLEKLLNETRRLNDENKLNKKRKSRVMYGNKPKRSKREDSSRSVEALQSQGVIAYSLLLSLYVFYFMSDFKSRTFTYTK